MNWLIGWAALTASQPAIADEYCNVRPDQTAVRVNESLKALAEAEQRDAAEGKPGKKERDAKRVEEVHTFFENGFLCTPEDKFNAAWVLRHSSNSDHLKLALEQATAAMNAHVPRAAWLTAIVFDRHQVYSGQPQRYGSMLGTPEGKLCLYAIDESTTDEDRAVYGMPPIETQLTKVLQANGIREEATLREVKRRGLICPAVHRKGKRR